MYKGRIASFTFYLASPAGVGVVKESFGGLFLDKFLYREDPPQGPTPYPLQTIFDRKSIPVVHFYQQMVPILHTYNSLHPF